MYVELHTRSAFSFLEGASVPEELIAAGLAMDMPAMALLDRDGVYGAPRFHLCGKKNGIKAHIGAEISVNKPNNQGICSVPVLVRNRTGYQNLCRLITLMKLRVPKHAKPGECVATADELAAHAKGLICLTGSFDGPIATALNPGDPDNAAKAQSTTEWLIDLFGKKNVYAELQRHLDREEEARNHLVIEIARRNRLPLLATNGVCHATPAQREVSDVFTCIRNHVRLETAGRLLAQNSERYLKSGATMEKLFADLPEAIANTSELSSRLEFTLEDLGYEFPKYPVPRGETMTSFLRKRTEEGARLRYTGTYGMPTYERARPQLERELTLIEKLKLEGYFLIVWDIVQFCNRQGILVQGRGSAANSAVCYSLGITAVDPVGMDLLFERFLSEERGEWPDIDLDLPSGDDREKAIQYVYERYGKHGAAMTANVITYRGRSAAREVGKVLDFDDETLARLSALVHTWEWKDPNDSSERQFRDAGLDLRQPRIKKFFQLYQRVQDLPRHLGQHSGGMVICQGQLDAIVPLEPAAMPGRVVVQWDKEDCADLGLIKVDLLGLGMMSVLKDSIELISDAYGEEVDLAHLPHDPVSLRSTATCRHDRHVPGRKPRPDVVPAATAARELLRHRGPGRDHSARPNCGKHGPSVSQTPAGQGTRDLCASDAGAGLKTHARSTVVSGATPAHGHDLRRLFGWRGRGAATRVWLQTLGSAHEIDRRETARRVEEKRHHRGEAGGDRTLNQLVCTLRFSRVACRKLCPHCLCECVSEV